MEDSTNKFTAVDDSFAENTSNVAQSASNELYTVQTIINETTDIDFTTQLNETDLSGVNDLDNEDLMHTDDQNNTANEESTCDTLTGVTANKIINELESNENDSSCNMDDFNRLVTDQQTKIVETQEIINASNISNSNLNLVSHEEEVRTQCEEDQVSVPQQTESNDANKEPPTCSLLINETFDQAKAIHEKEEAITSLKEKPTEAETAVEQPPRSSSSITIQKIPRQKTLNDTVDCANSIISSKQDKIIQQEMNKKISDEDEIKARSIRRLRSFDSSNEANSFDSNSDSQKSSDSSNTRLREVKIIRIIRQITTFTFRETFNPKNNTEIDCTLASTKKEKEIMSEVTECNIIAANDYFNQNSTYMQLASNMDHEHRENEYASNHIDYFDTSNSSNSKNMAKRRNTDLSPDDKSASKRPRKQDKHPVTINKTVELEENSEPTFIEKSSPVNKIKQQNKTSTKSKTEKSQNKSLTKQTNGKKSNKKKVLKTPLATVANFFDTRVTRSSKNVDESPDLTTKEKSNEVITINDDNDEKISESNVFTDSSSSSDISSSPLIDESIDFENDKSSVTDCVLKSKTKTPLATNILNISSNDSNSNLKIKKPLYDFSRLKINLSSGKPPKNQAPPPQKPNNNLSVKVRRITYDSVKNSNLLYKTDESENEADKSINVLAGSKPSTCIKSCSVKLIRLNMSSDDSFRK